MVGLEEETHGDRLQGERGLGEPELPGGEPRSSRPGCPREDRSGIRAPRSRGSAVQAKSWTLSGDVAVDREVSLLRLGDALPRRADDEAGDRERHVEVAEVGVELGIRVKRVAVPAAGGPPPHSGGLVHADLGEPLADEVVVADVAGAREDLRELRAEGDRERDLAVGGTGVEAAPRARSRPRRASRAAARPESRSRPVDELADGLRSAPEEVFIERTSIQPQS